MNPSLDGVGGSWTERSDLVAQAVDGDPRAVITPLCTYLRLLRRGQ